MTREQMTIALHALPPLQVACLVLSKRDHMKNEQIAEAIGIPVEEVRKAFVTGLCTIMMLEKVMRGIE